MATSESVLHRDRVAALDARVDAETRRLREAAGEQPSGLRQEALLGILGAQAHFDGVPARRQRVLRPRQRRARRDRELGVDEIDAGDRFRDRVLDLQPRVHLEEVEARLVAGPLEQELDRAGVDVAGGARGGHGGLAHARPHRRRQRRGRRLLDDLLVPPLDRALPLEQVDAAAVRVGEDLDLDVAGTLDPPLHVERAVAERARGLAPRRGNRLVERVDVR